MVSVANSLDVRIYELLLHRILKMLKGGIWGDSEGFSRCRGQEQKL